MIIDNKRVQGIYVYNSNIEYTKDDLVVSGKYIYICDAEKISGIDPAEDTSYEYYRPYPGSKIISASEYFQYLKGGEDKYVSSQALKGILQGYQFGLDMEGVITDWIDKNGDTTLKLSSITERPIDNLMLTETLNRGMVKIDWRLKQIVDGTVDNIPFSTMFGFLEKKDGENLIEYQLILSQYTYKQTEDLYIRIQEMTSPLSGVSVYRYMSWRDGEFPSNGSTISNWRNVFSYSSAIQSKLDTLGAYYNKVADQLSAQVGSLIGSFRFKEIYAGSSFDDNNGTTLNELEEGIYTICLEGTVSEDKYTESMTVRIKRGMTSYNVSPFKLEGKVNLSWDSESDSGTISITDDNSSSTHFISVYTREEKT